MKRSIFIIYLIFLIIINRNYCFSQETSTILPNTPGKIYLENGGVIKFTKIQKTGIGFNYLLKDSIEQKQVSFADVYEIRQYSGNYIAEYGAGCALVALLTATISTINWNEDSDLKDIRKPFIIYSTLGGGLIGLITGATQKKIKLVYSSEENDLSFVPIFRIIQKENYNMLYYQFSIKLSF